jgi:NifU-like protein
MSFYPPKISENFNVPRNAGEADAANAVGTNATFVCGAVLRFTLRIDRESKEIAEAKFKTNGCGFAIAVAEVLAEKTVGKHLAELHGLNKDFLQREIENDLGAFDEHRKHCLELALDSLQNAFADFRAAQIEEWTGEKALVCTCFGVSEETVEQIIETEAAQSVEEITAVCNAGGGCGSCRFLIQEMIDVYWSENN